MQRTMTTTTNSKTCSLFYFAGFAGRACVVITITNPIILHRTYNTRIGWGAHLLLIYVTSAPTHHHMQIMRNCVPKIFSFGSLFSLCVVFGLVSFNIKPLTNTLHNSVFFYLENIMQIKTSAIKKANCRVETRKLLHRANAKRREKWKAKKKIYSRILGLVKSGVLELCKFNVAISVHRNHVCIRLCVWC